MVVLSLHVLEHIKMPKSVRFSPNTKQRWTERAPVTDPLGSLCSPKPKSRGWKKQLELLSSVSGAPAPTLLSLQQKFPRGQDEGPSIEAARVGILSGSGGSDHECHKPDGQIF